RLVANGARHALSERRRRRHAKRRRNKQHPNPTQQRVDSPRIHRLSSLRRRLPERMCGKLSHPPIHSRNHPLRGMSSSSAASVTGANSARDPWYLATTPLETGPWLVRMRWATVVVELLLLAMTFALPALDLPLDHIAWLILVDATM